MTEIQNLLSSFSQIDATSKRKEKDEILMRLRSSEIAHTVLGLATDPTLNFWVTAKHHDERLYSGNHVTGSMDTRYSEFIDLTTSLSTRAATGAAAINAVETFLSKCSNMAPYFEAKWYGAVINRHLNIGISSASISKVWPDLISDFAVPLAESLYEQKTGLRVPKVEKAIVFPITLEPKLDGINVSTMDKGPGTASSRGQGTFPAFRRWIDAFKAAMDLIEKRIGKRVPEWVVNGEFKADRHPNDPKNWKSSWGKTVALSHAGLSADGFDESRIDAYSRECLDRDVYYVIYDTYPFSAYAVGKYNQAYGHRDTKGTRSAMCAMIVKAMKEVDPGLRVEHVKQVVCNNWEEANIAHAANLKAGAEGSMIKLFNSPCYLDRTTHIVKWKMYSMFDAVVLAVEEGTGKNRGIRAGAWVCYLPDKDTTANITVRTDAVKEWAWAYRDRIAGFKLEVTQQDDGGSGETVATTRNPVLKRFRIDTAPLDLVRVQALCRRFKLPIPSRQLNQVEYTRMVSEFKL